jgi:hypothetical protein
MVPLILRDAHQILLMEICVPLQQMLVWDSSPKALLLKRLGDELLEEAKKVHIEFPILCIYCFSFIFQHLIYLFLVSGGKDALQLVILKKTISCLCMHYLSFIC